jgi:hypothetical protein
MRGFAPYRVWRHNGFRPSSLVAPRENTSPPLAYPSVGGLSNGETVPHSANKLNMIWYAEIIEDMLGSSGNVIYNRCWNASESAAL